MATFYCLMYDADAGNSEDWNPVHMLGNDKVEVFATKQYRDKRVAVLKAIFEKLEDPSLEDVIKGYSLIEFEVDSNWGATKKVPKCIQDNLDELEYSISVQAGAGEITVAIEDKQKQ